MKAGVITFPGSNCDRDALSVLRATPGVEVTSLWHADTDLPKLDLIVVPGGFSYGDYLRSGAIAAHSPIMQQVKKHADKGGYVLGVCNGFQVLTESGLLPGILLRNRALKFICRDVELVVENSETSFTSQYSSKQRVTFPIAHHDGNYFIEADGLKALQDNAQIAFTYANDNPNGSVANIAGIYNEKKNVLGLMPHPERMAESALGGQDGALLFASLAAI